MYIVCVLRDVSRRSRRTGVLISFLSNIIFSARLLDYQCISHHVRDLLVNTYTPSVGGGYSSCYSNGCL